MFMVMMMTDKLLKDDVNIYTNSTLRKLDERIKKLEKKTQEKEDEELDWALNQFRYKEKTKDERIALNIIERRLGLRKTPLR